MTNLDNYSYTRFCGPQNLHRSLNILRGIVTGISIDGKLADAELKELNNWCNEVSEFKDRSPFNEIVPPVMEAASDGIIDLEELYGIQWFLDKAILGNEYYNAVTSRLQELQGIMHGILSDGEISDEEIYSLEKWMDDNEWLQSSYPYDELNALIFQILTDKKITEQERSMLEAFFREFVKFSTERQISDTKHTAESLMGLCSVTPEISFRDKLFCFTGMSVRAKRSELVSMIESHGGRFTKNPTQHLDYLIYGAAGNQCWTFSCYGRKVEKVIRMRKKGLPVIIVHENDFWDSFEDYKL